MLFILILNSDTLLQKPISVKWKIPGYVFRLTKSQFNLFIS